MSKKRLLLLVVLFLLIAAVGAVAYVTAGKTEKSPSYRFAAVERGDVMATVTSTGTLNAVTTVEVGTQVSGTIAALYADFNTTVRAGQVVALIDTTFLHASVVDAQASLERVHASLMAAQRKLERAKALFSRNLTSQSDMDDAQTAMETSVAQEKQSQAALDRAMINLRYATIRAPIDGVVIDRSVDAGQTVAASMSAPKLFVIANDLSQMELQLSVDEADVGRVKEGQRVSFTVDAYPEQQFDGRVYQVRLFPQTVQNVVTYKIIVRVENKELKLRPGMTANATVLIDRREDVLKLPLASLRYVPSADQLAALRTDMMKAPGGGSAADSSRSWWSRLVSIVKRDSAPDTTRKGSGARVAAGGGVDSSRAGGSRDGGGWGTGSGWGGAGSSSSGGWGSTTGSSAGGGWGSSGTSAARAGSGSAGSTGTGWGGASGMPAGTGAGAAGTGGGRVWIQTKDGKLKPVNVRIGIQDRSFTELIGDNLAEGQQVIVGRIGTSPAPAAQQASSPFGGGGGMRGVGGGRR